MLVPMVGVGLDDGCPENDAAKVSRSIVEESE